MPSGFTETPARHSTVPDVTNSLVSDGLALPCCVPLQTCIFSLMARTLHLHVFGIWTDDQSLFVSHLITFPIRWWFLAARWWLQGTWKESIKCTLGLLGWMWEIGMCSFLKPIKPWMWVLDFPRKLRLDSRSLFTFLLRPARMPENWCAKDWAWLGQDFVLSPA